MIQCDLYSPTTLGAAPTALCPPERAPCYNKLVLFQERCCGAGNAAGLSLLSMQ